MPQVSPFYGLMFDPAVAGPLERLVAPPYDTIGPEQQRRLYEASPHNVVRLILGRDEPGDDGENNKYTRAAQHLRSWLEQGALAETRSPAWFPYEMRFTFQGSPRRVRGLMCQVELEPLGGSILPHERTLPAPIEDRLALLREVRANLSAVYGLVRGPNLALAGLLEDATSGPPAGAVTDEDGVEHRLWVLEGAPEISEWLRDEQLLIADGHHRYTVALVYRDQMRAVVGPGPWDQMLMLVVDAGAEDPPVLPIHRLVLEGSVRADGRVVRDLAEVLATVRDDDLTFGTASLTGGRLEHKVQTLLGQPPTVYALHEQLLGHQPSLRFVPDAVVAEEAVRSGEAEMALFLPPTKVERIRSVIERGDRLPQKSTYFWPKPRTGMVLRPLLERVG